MDVVLDIVEPQDGIVFVAGYIGKTLAVGDHLTMLSVYQSPKKKKHKPKKMSSVTLELVIETILVDGEPLDDISAGKSAQIGLIGDPAPLLDLLSGHNWHQSNGRYFLSRKDTRLITLSGG